MKLFELFSLLSDPNDIVDIYIDDADGNCIAHTTYLSEEDYADIAGGGYDEDYVDAVKADYSALKHYENSIVTKINLLERYVVCKEG
jgi:hypothetical protein